MWSRLKNKKNCKNYAQNLAFFANVFRNSHQIFIDVTEKYPKHPITLYPLQFLLWRWGLDIFPASTMIQERKRVYKPPLSHDGDGAEYWLQNLMPHMTLNYLRIRHNLLKRTLSCRRERIYKTRSMLNIIQSHSPPELDNCYWKTLASVLSWLYRIRNRHRQPLMSCILLCISRIWASK